MSNNTDLPPNNGAVLTIAKIIKAVILSEAEDEMGALLTNCKEYIPESQYLEKMGNTQPPKLT